MVLLELKNVRISTIQLFEKTDHAASLAASLLDLSFLDFYIPVIFFYKSKELSNADELIASLKDSLTKVLVPFYPFAGRWVRTYDERIRELQCTDVGVPFIEASVDEELDSVLNNGNFEVRPELGGFRFFGMDPFAFHQDVDSPLPAVFVQYVKDWLAPGSRELAQGVANDVRHMATKFKCGGVTLNVSIAHMAADGQGMNLFLKAWSEFALHGETTITPQHDRSVILPKETFMEFLAAKMGTPPPTDASQSKPLESVESIGAAAKTDPGAAYKLRLLKPLLGQLFHVKREAVAELKRKAAEEKRQVTTVDLISAHLWQSVTTVANQFDNKPMSVLSTYVDGRTRFHDPPLSENYTGNTVILAGTPPVPSDELSSGTPSEAASILHTAVRGVNPTTWKYSSLQTVMKAGLPELPFSHLAISSWHRFPTYEVSFKGGYGKPVFLSLNMSCSFMPQGITFIFPPAASHSDDTIATVQVFVNEEDGFAKALYSDEKFLSIFHSDSHLLNLH